MSRDKLPAMPWYSGDWFKDTGLQRCTLAARGLWFELCLRMWDCAERGVLITGSRPWSHAEVAALISGPEKQTLTCLDELLREGVASCDERGAIFSRRMVRDEEVRQLRKAAGSKGGLATAKQAAKRTAKDSAKRIANSETETDIEDGNEIQKGRGERGEGKPARRVRARCPIWDAVAEIWFPSGVDDDDRTRIGKAVKRLKAKHATPDEIKARKRRQESEWANLGTATLESIVKHWDKFGPSATEKLLGKPKKGVDER